MSLNPKMQESFQTLARNLKKQQGVVYHVNNIEEAFVVAIAHSYMGNDVSKEYRYVFTLPGEKYASTAIVTVSHRVVLGLSLPMEDADAVFDASVDTDIRDLLSTFDTNWRLTIGNIIIDAICAGMPLRRLCYLLDNHAQGVANAHEMSAEEVEEMTRQFKEDIEEMSQVTTGAAMVLFGDDI